MKIIKSLKENASWLHIALAVCLLTASVVKMFAMEAIPLPLIALIVIYSALIIASTVAEYRSVVRK